MPRDDERAVPEYSREETEIISKLMNVDTARKEKQEEFNSMIKGTAEEFSTVRKQMVQITKKEILKQRLVHLYVSGCYTNREIAHILCVAPGTITKLLKNQNILDMIKTYQEEENEIVNAALKSLRLKAVETQGELLDSQSDMVRFNVTKDILDRTGHKAEEKKTVNVNHTYEERLKNLVDNVKYEIQDVPYVIDDEEDGENQINTEGEVNSD